MDELDAAILRALYADRVLFWGALDPRLSAEAVAKKLKVAPTTVRARLAVWRERGFLLRYEVIPHPAHFGCAVAAGGIRIADPRAKPQLLEDLSLVPEALAALDHVGEWVGFALVQESEAQVDRARRLLARLPGVADVSPCRPLPTPPCSQKMTPLDWRIARALRKDPMRPISAAAREVGITTKTFSRRYAQLVRSRALWFAPVVDFTKWGGGVGRFIVSGRDPSERTRVLAHLKRSPTLLDMERLPPMPGGEVLADAWIHLGSASAAEDVQRDLLAIQGVDSVEVLFPRKYDIFGSWSAARLARMNATPG